MTFYGFMRIFAGALALVLAISLIREIVAGRSRLGGHFVTRAEDWKTYWLLIIRIACSMLGMALAATIVPERLFGPVIALSFFVPALAAALLTGRFEWEADNKRIDSPRRFWGWVSFYAILCLMMGIIVVIELLYPRGL